MTMRAHSTPASKNHLIEVACCIAHDQGEPDYGPDREFDIPTPWLGRAEKDGVDPSELIRWAIAEEHFLHATIVTGLQTCEVAVWDIR